MIVFLTLPMNWIHRPAAAKQRASPTHRRQWPWRVGRLIHSTTGYTVRDTAMWRARCPRRLALSIAACVLATGAGTPGVTCRTRSGRTSSTSSRHRTHTYRCAASPESAAFTSSARSRSRQPWPTPSRSWTTQSARASGSGRSGHRKSAHRSGRPPTCERLFELVGRQQRAYKNGVLVASGLRPRNGYASRKALLILGPKEVDGSRSTSSVHTARRGRARTPHPMSAIPAAGRRARR